MFFGVIKSPQLFRFTRWPTSDDQISLHIVLLIQSYAVANGV